MASNTFNNSMAGMVLSTAGSNYNTEAESTCGLTSFFFVELEMKYKDILQEKIKKDF